MRFAGRLSQKEVARHLAAIERRAAQVGEQIYGGPMPWYGLAPEMACQRRRGATEMSTTTRRGTEGAGSRQSVVRRLHHRDGEAALCVLVGVPSDFWVGQALDLGEWMRRTTAMWSGPPPEESVEAYQATAPTDGEAVDHLIQVDGEPVRFVGWTVAGRTGVAARRTGHSIAVVSEGWALDDLCLVRLPDLTAASP